MTIIKYICDDCGENCNHLIEIPSLFWEGRELKAHNCKAVAELCERCAHARLDIFCRKGDHKDARSD